MITYNADGIREYNNTVNYGTKIVSSTKIISTTNTAAENIRFTFATGAEFAFEITWYEFNIYNNATQWTWWGDYGIYINTSATVFGRFGPTVRAQIGTNNGVGTFVTSGSSVYWQSYCGGGVSQNISSIYFIVNCSRWDKVTVSYPGITTTTTTTITPTTTTTTTSPPIPPTTTTTTTSPPIPPTTTTTTTGIVIPTTTTTTTVAPNYKYYFELVDLTNPPNLGGGSMTLNAGGGGATFVTNYNLITGSSSYGPSGSTATANAGKRIQKIDKIAYDGSTVLYTTNVAAANYTFPTGVFDMTSTGTGAGQFQTIKVYIENGPTTTTTTSTSTSTSSTTTSTSSTTSTSTTRANVTVNLTFQLDASNAGSMSLYVASPAGSGYVLVTTLTTNGATFAAGLLAGDAYYVTVTQTARANTAQRGQIQDSLNGTPTNYQTAAGALPQSVSSTARTLAAGNTYSVLGICGTVI